MSTTNDTAITPPATRAAIARTATLAKKRRSLLSTAALAAIAAAAIAPIAPAQALAPNESLEQRDTRMQWWRDARFGMFIHWGLYAVPAGIWNGKDAPGAGEWLLTNAKIPVAEYEPLITQFNPVEFDAKKWVQIAKSAGMRYIVITSKHHDGFCLWPSKFTEWDVESTPFKRDILGELYKACEEGGIRLCFYHSIMDWHHPDYLPRRAWDKRPADPTSYPKYLEHMKSQLQELLERYPNIGLLWFDGEWESTWTHEQGRDLYDWLRSLKPNLIINNRIDTGRSGMAGLTRDGDFRGDYGTPEQEIPATGFPDGVDWETCMTMNDTWGFKKNDLHWKSAPDMIRMLVDIASKGGNFLLNVGPDGRGNIPLASVERLETMGQWLKTNGPAIYGTKASPFPSLPWGRCTRQPLKDGKTRLYFCIFDWPSDGRLRIPGLLNEPLAAAALWSGSRLETSREGEAVVISVPPKAPDSVCSVVSLDITGPASVAVPPKITARSEMFIDSLAVEIAPGAPIAGADFSIRYTLDGSSPTKTSPQATGPVTIKEGAVVKAQLFKGDRPVSAASRAEFRKVAPMAADAAPASTKPGLRRLAFTAPSISHVQDFVELDPVSSSVVPDLSLDGRPRDEQFGMIYEGFITIPESGIWTFRLDSDDGSILTLGNQKLIDNDGLHSTIGKEASVALAKGPHHFRLSYFNGTGQRHLGLLWEGPGTARGPVPAAAFLHGEAAK